MSRKSSNTTSHDEAVSIIEKLASGSLGGILEATGDCNQCTEKLRINLLEGASSLSREQSVGTVRPDISLFDENGKPVRFIEVVDSHAPESTVHAFALENHIEIVEIHLRADKEFIGTRRNKALDASLTVKARLQELADGRILIDAHNLLCGRPKCRECGTPLPMRTITVSAKDCWKCGGNVTVATGDKDGQGLEQDYFTTEEIEFAHENGVTLERRFSATVGEKYLANVCTQCDQIQGNWFLYMDPFHDRFKVHKTQRQTYGPCDQCSTFYCWTHGEYVDYGGANDCPTCLAEAERVMCPNNTDRDCFYPDKCEESGCYFLNREQQRNDLRDQLKQDQRIYQRHREQQRRDQQEQYEQQQRKLAEFQEWFNRRLSPPEQP